MRPPAPAMRAESRCTELVRRLLMRGTMTTHRNTVLSLALVGATAALVACGGAKPPEAAAPSSSTALAGQPQPSTATPAAPPPTSANVAISDEIRTKCGISDADAYFPFDSAHITNGRTPLDLVAKCFTKGPLAGRAVKLVGRADPRGEADYNITLGQSRADAVSVYLDVKGMQKSKTQSTSRGAMDAQGTNETSWQRDRRVDVVLGD
jgi:peptidoglycan-associated lipoprotein